MHVKVYSQDDDSDTSYFRSSQKTMWMSDNTVRLQVTGLQPYTKYAFSVCFSETSSTMDCDDRSCLVTFYTAALPDQDTGVKLVWGGDLAGQNVCRDIHDGYAIFKTMADENAHLAVLSGDMIYADNLCEHIRFHGNKQVVGDFNLSNNMEDFRAHWAYNREDKYYREFLSNTQVLVAWDDHEIVNVRISKFLKCSHASVYLNIASVDLTGFFHMSCVQRLSRTPDRLTTPVQTSRQEIPTQCPRTQKGSTCCHWPWVRCKNGIRSMQQSSIPVTTEASDTER